MNRLYLLLFLAILLIPIHDIYGLGLVWRGVDKSGSLVSDLGDVGGGCVNGEIYEFQSSNSTWICGTDSIGNGLTSANMVSQNATIMQSNSTTGFTLKNIGDGNYITWFNNTSSLIANLLPIPTSIITGLDTLLSTFFNNISPTNTGSGNFTLIGDNSSQRATIKTISQGTGIALTNDANNIVISSTVTDTDTGFTNLASSNTVNATIVAYNATNPITKAVFKTLSCGTGCYITNNTDNLVIVNTVVDTDTDTNTTIISSISNTNATLIADNSTSTNNIRLKGISAGTGIQIDNGTNSIIIKATGSGGGFTTIASELATSNNATLVSDNSTVANRAVIKTISAGTGLTLINGSNYVQINVTNPSTILLTGSNITTSQSTVSYSTVFSIPLTGNSMNLITANIVTASNFLASGPQFYANYTNTGTQDNFGTCSYQTPTAATTISPDHLPVLYAGQAVTDTGTTTMATTNATNTFITCAVLTKSASPGSLNINYQSAVTNNPTNLLGGYYTKIP